MTGAELALVGIALNGAIVLVIAWSMWRIRRAVSPEAAEFRRRLAETPFPQPIGFTALYEAHHSIGQTVDRHRRGVITADEAIAAIHEQVGDETDRTAERDAEESPCGRCGGTRIEPGSEDYDAVAHRDNPYTGEPCSACQSGDGTDRAAERDAEMETR